MSVTKQSLKSLVLLALGLSALSAVEAPEILQLRSKAVRGNPVAQYMLARLFADEHSSNFDRSEAYVWFQLAADNGATGKELARLVEVMTPTELEQGKLRLKERREQIGALASPSTPASSATSEDAVAKLQAERDQLVNTLNATTAELAALKAGAPKSSTGTPAGSSKLEAELNETRAAARQLAAKTQQLEDVASERGRALQAALTELEKVKASAQPESQAIVALRADRDLLVKQLEEAQVRARKLAELPERLARAERDTELLRSQNVKLARELKDLQGKTAEPAPVVLSKPDESAPFAEKLAANEKVLEFLRGENRKLTDELKASQARMAELNKAAEGGKEASALAAQLSSAQAEVDNLRIKNAELGKRFEELMGGQQDLAVMRERLSNEQRRAEELAASAAKLALDNERLRREATGVGATAQELGSLKEKLSALERQNVELAQRATVAETKLASAPPQEAVPSTEVQQQLNESADKLSTALRSYTVLQQELEQNKTAASQAAAEYEAKLTSAQSEISALKAQLSSTSGESQDRAHAIEAGQQEIQQLRAATLEKGQEILALRDQLRQTLAQLSSVAEENAQLKTRLAVLAPPPGSTLASPTRPGTAAAQAAITVPELIRVPTPPQPRQHVIGDGDTLSKISRRYYGTPDRWNDIYQANRNLLNDPSRLPKGAALKIP